VNTWTARWLAASSGPVGPGPLIGRRAAQQLARRELSRSIYSRPLATRIADAIERFLERLFHAAATNLPGGWWSTIAGAVILVLVVAAVLFWVRPAGSRQVAGRQLLSGEALSARDHRKLAEQHAAAGDYSAALVEAMRAVAVEIEERGILPVRPGRTADEFAVQAGRAVPELAADFTAAATLFDDVRYGGRQGTPIGYARISRLDARLRAARAASAQVALADGVAAGLP
jgi:Domain of unknown function (DUF4129)